MRIAHPSSGEPPSMVVAKEESPARIFRALEDRCESLEKSQESLREQLDKLMNQKKKRKEDEQEEVVMAAAMTMSKKSDSAGDSSEHLLPASIPGHFSSGSPYRSVLESLGHALHVSEASTGEIIYWNRSAEKLYGWKYCEVVGQGFGDDILIPDQHFVALQKVTESLRGGKSWSGQFPLKKRSGEIFMALVTKSPLYENGVLVGFITVASDAALLNKMKTQNLMTHENDANSQHRERQSYLKRIQWHGRPPIAPVPEIASSVSNLASKIFSRGHGDNESNTSRDKEDSVADTKDVKTDKTGSLAEKLLAKLHVRGTGNGDKQDDGRNLKNGASDNLQSSNEPNFRSDSKSSTSSDCIVDTNSKAAGHHRKNNISLAAKRHACEHEVPRPNEDGAVLASSREFKECLTRLDRAVDAKEAEPVEANLNAVRIENEVLRYPDGKQCSSSGASTHSLGSSSSKGDNESNSIVDCEIHWEDLQLGEEIGQGSYAIVYHGIWNGSDVAIKVYFGNQYTEGTLQEYKKEIDIMKRSRHPNVLLFMGAAYSQERLAIVTEFLPRGSLFKTLHKNNQKLDIRRRLRMALDVARGMNYLHHRNPPIVHRDLKSSNLLVDRNWSVKVGDFGLSKLKNGAFLTTKSGRGTPQWMAPEVLRSELSNEKSDVFSFGVILWELMTEAIPWNHLNSLQVVGVVGFMDRRLDLPEGLDPQVASIIRDCWRSDPQQRPSFEDIIQRMMMLLQRAAPLPSRKNSEPLNL